MSNKKSENSSVPQRKGEAGFTLVEAVIAIFVVTIALIGTAAALTFALEFGAISRNVTSAKTVIVSSVEEIETLRNARRLEFKQIANVGAVNNLDTARPFNGFSTGFRDISSNPGADGVFGTNDDVVTPPFIRDGYKRQITITNLSDSLKKIEVKVRYVGRAGKWGEISGVAYLNDEARITK